MVLHQKWYRQKQTNYLILGSIARATVDPQRTQMEHVVWVVYCPRTIVQPIRPALITTQDIMMCRIMRPVHYLLERSNYLLWPHNPSLELLLHHQFQPHPQPLLRIPRDGPLIVQMKPSGGRR